MQGAKPPIWREIIVPEDYTFFNLHVAIQDAMGWTDSHLHQFFIGNPSKGQTKYIAWPNPDMEVDMDEREIEINRFLKKEKDSVFYEYDFGDGWTHRIELKKILGLDQKSRYPQIVAGKNACPPEDCGGLWGYYDLIEIINNPKHEEREDVMDWLGIENPEDFKPGYFDKDKVVFNDPKRVLKFYKENFG